MGNSPCCFDKLAKIQGRSTDAYAAAWKTAEAESEDSQEEAGQSRLEMQQEIEKLL